MLRKWLPWILFFSGIIIGASLFLYWRNLSAPRTQMDSSIVLQQVREITKLATAEGYFSEILTYKQYWQWDISPFRKKALVQIKAKVLVGFDLDQVKLEVRTTPREIRIGPLPAATLLSMDPELSYYDLQEGTFNAFAPEDLSLIDQQARSLIRAQVAKSGLYEAARKKLDSQLQWMKTLAEQNGWKLILADSSSVLPR